LKTFWRGFCLESAPEYGVGGCLLLAAKSLFSGAEVCVHVSEVQLQLLTVWVLDSDKHVVLSPGAEFARKFWGE